MFTRLVRPNSFTIVATLRVFFFFFLFFFAHPTSSEKIVCDQLIYCCFTFKSSFKNTYFFIETYGGVRISGVRPSTWGGVGSSNCERSEQMGVQGAGPLTGVARGQRPLAKEKVEFCELNMHNSSPGLNLQCGHKGIAHLFIRHHVFEGMHDKCTISVPFLPKFMTYIRLGGCKGVVPPCFSPCLRKFCILRAKINMRNIRPFLV